MKGTSVRRWTLFPKTEKQPVFAARQVGTYRDRSGAPAGFSRRRHPTSAARRDIDHWGNSPGMALVLTRENNSTLRQGEPMMGQLEFNLRATLCRKLAKREPANRILWMAEAESWSRLSKEGSGDAAEEKISSGLTATLREQSARVFLILA